MPVFDGGVFDANVFDVLTGTPLSVYWGPHFPDAAGVSSYFGPHFPDGVARAGVTPPATIGGAATFLLLQSGSKLVLSYGEDTINKKTWSGAEYRESMLDDPKRTFVGKATLLGGDVRSLRAKLARLAAIGTVFSLGIPFEAITVTGKATGNTIPTSSTARCDWMQLGQRVVITDQNAGSTPLEAVLQDFTANSVTIDRPFGPLGRSGVIIMPLVPVYFDPSMSAERSRGPEGVEQWQLNARAAVFGYPVAANRAFASLSGATGALAVAVAYWAAFGTVGNGKSIALVGDSALDGGSVTNVGDAYTFHFKPGVTSVFAMQIALDLGPAFFDFAGVDPAAVLLAGDAVGPFTLRGGTDLGYGTPGTGATVATYDGRPLWDRRVQVDGTATDSIQSLAELVDLGGIPISIGTATQPDWGRALFMQRTDIAEWQWIKAFLAAVRGCQRAFWLPSGRADLLPVGWTGTSLTIFGPEDETGGLPSWFPSQRDRIEILQADGNLVRAQIIAATDNHDGTMSLDCRDPAPATTVNASATFTAGHLLARGCVLHANAIGVAGNVGSIELRADGTGGDPISGGGAQFTDDGAGNIVVHFHPGNVFISQILSSLVSLYPVTWTPSPPPSALADLTDVQGPIPFTGGVGPLGDVITLTGAAITRVSWLELCRFDSPVFEFTFAGGTFSLKTKARVVQK